MSPMTKLKLLNGSGRIPAKLHLARWIGHQRWIPKGQDAVLRALIHPDTGQDLPFEVDFFGYRYRGNAGNFCDWTVLLYGASDTSELSVLDRVARYLRSQHERVIYFDIGANVGHHLLFMTGLADECYGVDPNGRVLARAREKIELNQVKNTKLYQVALGDENQAKPYFAPASANEGTGSFLADWSKANSDTPVCIEIRKADEFLAEEGISKINILKIDVEGFEAAVLRGLKEVIKRERPFILLELSRKGLDQLGGEAGLRSILFDSAVLFLVKYYRSFRHSLDAYRVEPGDSELLILPPEYMRAFWPDGQAN
jgi:FkbM family methyltransferase